MDFTLSEDEEALKAGVRDLCTGRFPMERVRSLEEAGGVNRQAWRELAEAGTFSLRLGEEAGGAGLGSAHAVLVFEELGRALVPGPLVWSHLAGGLVEGAATGEVVVGGVMDPELAGAGTAVAGSSAGAPPGAPVLVEHARNLGALVLLDRDGVWSVDMSELSLEAVRKPLDPLTPVFLATGLARGDRLGDVAVAGRWWADGAVLTAALLLGAAEALTDLAVAYAKEREQFDRPIGSFQAVKHMLADMLVRTEIARSAVYAAGATLDDPEVGEPRRAAAGAKLLAGEAALTNGKACIQVHGGMGYTWEVDAHLYLKRARVLDTVFGSVDDHAEALAACL